MDAARLDQLTMSFRQPQIVFAALRSGLFELLAGERLDAEEIASRLQLDPRATRILADALVGMELLEKEGGRYRNAAVSNEVLVRSSAGSKVDRYLLGARQYERWAELTEAVKRGGRSRDEGPDREPPRSFAAAMADVGRASSLALLDAVDLDGVERMLDIGGGPGIYAIACAERHPQLRAVVFDRRETVEVAGENIAQSGLEERVTTLAGDAFVDDLEGPYDFILLSNFLHMFAADEIRALLARAASALAPGGRLCVKDFLLDEDRTSPAGCTLFAVNMLISTEGGEIFTGAEIAEWLRGVGLEVEERIALTEMTALVLARRVDAAGRR